LGLVVAVCLVLLLLAVAHASFAHCNDADHCPVCMAIHLVLPLVVITASIALVIIGGFALLFPEDHGIVRYWFPTLFTRPPPVAC